MVFLLGLLAAICSVCAASFTFLAKIQRDDEKKATKRLFLTGWTSLRNAPWRNLPYDVAVWFVGKKVSIAGVFDKLMDGKRGYIHVFGVPILSGIGMWLWLGAVPAIYVSLVAAAGAVGDYFIQTRRLGLEYGYTHWRNLLDTAVYGSLGTSWVFCGIAWTVVLTNMTPIHAAFLATVLAPFVSIQIAFPSSVALRVSQLLLGRVSITFSDIFDREWKLFTLSGSFSYVLTFYALALGEITSAIIAEEVTIQFIVSNVFFDALTVIVSLFTLGFATGPSGRRLWVPLVFLAEIVLASVFACLSVFVGLYGTTQQLSFRQVAHILLARSADGGSFELSPYFWSMHTTFIPVVLLFLIVCVAWIGRMGLVAVEWFTGRGKDSEEPLALVSALFTLLAVVFGTFAYLFGKG